MAQLEQKTSLEAFNGVLVVLKVFQRLFLKQANNSCFHYLHILQCFMQLQAI